MLTRLQKFHNYKDCPVHRGMYKRLTKQELAACEKFIIENETLDKNKFAEKVNRWYLDDSQRPKHYTDMWALVLSSNVGVAYGA